MTPHFLLYTAGDPQLSVSTIILVASASATGREVIKTAQLIGCLIPTREVIGEAGVTQERLASRAIQRARAIQLGTSPPGDCLDSV